VAATDTISSIHCWTLLSVLVAGSLFSSTQLRLCEFAIDLVNT